MSKLVVIIGTGGHAKVVHDILIQEGKFKPAAFFSLDKNLKSFLELPHYHQDEFGQHEFTHGVVAIGDNWLRAQAVRTLNAINSKFQFVTTVHPSAVVGNGVKLGVGTVVMANAVVNPFSVIGDHIIINTSASVDHDCQLENYCSIAPGAVLGGNVKVGQYSAVSLGAKIIHGRSIGEQTVIGAGALVVGDVGSGVVAYGTPCEAKRNRKAGEKYL
ncbi:MAG: acetyltransferase [Bdellovibrionota bacterium]